MSPIRTVGKLAAQIRRRFFNGANHRPTHHRPLTVSALESRLTPAVRLTYAGLGTALDLTEMAAGSTPDVTISDNGTTALTIDLGAAFFDAASTIAATGLTYENADSPTTSHFATIDLSAINNVNQLSTNLAGDTLNIGRIVNSKNGLIDLDVSAAKVVLGGNTINTHGTQIYGSPVELATNVALNATAAGDVIFNSTIQSPGTQFNFSVGTGANIIFNGAIGGGGNPLAVLNTSADAIQVNGESVNTSGFSQHYGASTMTLGKASTLMAGEVFISQSLILGKTATTATSFLQVAGNLFLAPSETTLTTTLAGPNQFGHIEVSGFTAFTGAFFAINYAGGFTPAIGQSFDIVSNGFDSIGEFSNVPSPGPVILGDVAYSTTYSGSGGGSDFILTVINPNIIAVGADAGSDPVVNVYNADGSLRFTIMAYAPEFRGGVRVGVGDVNGDGFPDVITGAGPSGGPHVKAFHGQTGALIHSFFAYAANFLGGVNVATGDINNDGVADIITGAGPGGGPHVEVFSGTNLALLASFFAYDPLFAGGVAVGSGDIDNDGVADIITGAGPGGGPHVKVFSGANQSELRSFFAYDAQFAGGVFVAGGDFDIDGFDDIVTGAGIGGSPHVKVFSGQTEAVLASYFAYDPNFLGGVRVGTGDLNGDGLADVITGAGPGGGPHVIVYDNLTTTIDDSFYAFAPTFGFGVYVA